MNDFLQLKTPEFLATVAPDFSANLIRLFHRASGLEILRTPQAVSELESRPVLFGIPLLMQPNRIADGEFSFEGRRYRLPVNERRTHCNNHGLLLKRKFSPLEIINRGDEAEAAFEWEFNENYPEYDGFPHRFRVEIRYRLAGSTLFHRLAVRNGSRENMPLGVGYHTAFVLPAAENPRLNIPHADGCWQVHPERRLPTGKRERWPESVLKILDGQSSPAGQPVAAMFPLDNQPRQVRIERRNLAIDYRFDEKFIHFAAWNDDGAGDFFCLEPMSTMTDAPNLPLPPEVTGLRGLPPGRTICFHQQIHMQEQRDPA